MQLKQSTQRLWSINTFSLVMEMQWALQRVSHDLQRTHFSLSIMGRNIAKRERKLSVVPTGQTLLQ